MSAQVLAQQVAGVFETLNAKPPGVLASLALLGAHGAGFLVALAALVLPVVFLFGRHGDLSRLFRRRTDLTPYAYAPGQTQEWRGAAAPAGPSPSVTLVATYPDAQAAQAQFAALPAELPRRATLRWFGRHLLLTLPQEEGAEAGRWADRLRRQTREVPPVLSKGSAAHVQLACVLPDEEKAERVREELDDYLRASNHDLLLAPWSAAWQALPAADRERFRKARRTLGRLQHVQEQAAASPEVRAHLGHLGDKLGPRDPDAVHAELVAFQQAREAEEKRLLAGILAEGEETVDHRLEMVQLWQRWTDATLAEDEAEDDPGEPARKRETEARQRRLKELRREMAERMGSLPLTGDRPRPGTDAEAAQHGYVLRKQASLSIGSVSFRQLDKGLPALAEWLGQQGGKQVRYRIDITPLQPQGVPEQE